jgi:tRNA dimethylallyltransferase
MRQRQKLIVIVGPTASGKSEFAVKIAQRYNGEIISADSRQVYRGLDIGTAKVPGTWKAGVFVYKKIPHHCIDFISPQKIYSVAKYQQCANAAIQRIAHRGKIPILVGGTGLWIDAVVYDWHFPHVPPNRKLRVRLERKTTPQLLAMLTKLDPNRAATIEQKNPRRLIRAIEIATALGSVPALQKDPLYDTLIFGLNPTPVILERRITDRAQKMIRAGFIAEIKKLRASRITKKRIREFGFEYRAGLDYVEGGSTIKVLGERIIYDTRAYAHRQMTWFGRNPDITWNPSAREIRKRILALVTSRLPDPIETAQKRT